MPQSTFTFFFFNDTATTEIYTLSLHDALPICGETPVVPQRLQGREARMQAEVPVRSEEHTSELQSQSNLVCRLLLEKKKKNKKHTSNNLIKYIRKNRIFHTYNQIASSREKVSV